jgi:threonine/homoserine/homoserine lactone efflux protein
VDGLAGFVLLSVALSLTPGPDDVLVLSCAVRGGLRCGAASAFGVAAGSLAWGAAAATGGAAIVSGSPGLYEGMRWAGAAYLVVIGASSLAVRAPGRHAAAAVRAGEGGYVLAVEGADRRAFAAGLLSDLLNPKIGAFYVMVLPQFVPAAAPVLQYSLFLCAIDVALATVWLLSLTWLAHLAVGWLQRPPVVRWSRRVLGATLIGIGVGAVAGLG